MGNSVTLLYPGASGSLCKVPSSFEATLCKKSPDFALSPVFLLFTNFCWGRFLSNESSELCRLAGGVIGALGRADAFFGLGFCVGLKAAGVYSVLATGPFLCSKICWEFGETVEGVGGALMGEVTC